MVGQFGKWCTICQNFLASTYKHNEITEDLLIDCKTNYAITLKNFPTHSM